MKKLISLLIIFLLNFSLVLANGSHGDEIEKGKSLVESKADCSKLADEDLEAIGEYLMEQMHLGEQHETMNNMMTQMMGEEGEEQMHVNLARMRYCGESGMSSSGDMMGMMNMMGGRNMMGNFGGMISTSPALMWFWSLLVFLLLLGLVVLVWVLVVKYWKEVSRRK